ncbi:P-loop containing nucleoside triphosphate hydrolase protein [Aspergillus lucknowensis]|uniref:P-loop containing nucleoside triphosphate hydrolase protein n=1 Tax=Aspergillus lucknowensis TaxID=176173 RepID=A0ABR4LKD8_9EURO
MSEDKSDAIAHSIWARNWASFNAGQFRDPPLLANSTIRDPYDLGHLEDIKQDMPKIPDGPYVFSNKEMAEIEGGRSVPQPEYKKVIDVPTAMGVAAGKVEAYGHVIDIDEYLGQDWEDEFIKPLYHQEPAATPDTFAVKPHSWQLKGAAQIHYLCRSVFRGGICGDEMGLGKALLAVHLMELARQEPGSFSVIVCPASCRMQWRSEILGSYKEGTAPRTLILDNQKMTLHEIWEHGYEIVIVSYPFLCSQLRNLESVNAEFRDFRDCKLRVPPTIPTCALFDNALRLTGKPIKRLILDECQNLKKEDGANFKAVNALYRSATVLLSGTILDNTWSDIINPLLLLKGHPFTNRGRLISALLDSKQKKSYRLELTDTGIVCIQRLLMALMVARPSSVLELPEMSQESIEFSLNDDEIYMVNHHIGRYKAAQAQRQSWLQKGVNTSFEVAMRHAVDAQLWASHSLLITHRALHDPKAGPEDTDETQVDLDGMATNLVSEIEYEDPKTRGKWLASLQATPLPELLKSSRMAALLKTWSDARLKYPDEKIVIFSKFRKFLEIFGTIMKKEYGIEPLMFHGLLTHAEKAAARKSFADCESKTPLLITAQAGSCGLNLQQASIVIQAEIWWNANTEKQARARCYRQGQEKDVRWFRLFAPNSAIDTEIDVVQRRKSTVNSKIMKPLVRKDEAPLVVPRFPTPDPDTMSLDQQLQD